MSILLLLYGIETPTGDAGPEPEPEPAPVVAAVAGAGLMVAFGRGRRHAAREIIPYQNNEDEEFILS